MWSLDYVVPGFSLDGVMEGTRAAVVDVVDGRFLSPTFADGDKKRTTQEHKKVRLLRTKRSDIVRGLKL